MVMLSSITSLSLVSCSFYVAALSFQWLICVAIYRLFFHPLAKVPGPFLAAVTYLYIFKHNAFGSGGRSQFYLLVEELHKKYGPIIRISPNEIHLSDPENYEKIYSTRTKYTKNNEFYRGLAIPNSTFGTSSSKLHRMRRAALNPFFSPQAVLQLEDVVQSAAMTLCGRMEEAFQVGQFVDLHHGFRALSVDVATDYAFNKSYDLLKSPDLGKVFGNMIKELAPRTWIVQQFPLLTPLSKNIPLRLVRRLNKTMGVFLEQQEVLLAEIKEIEGQLQRGEKLPDRKTIFHQLLDPNSTTDHNTASATDVNEEAMSLLLAAADTVGATLTAATYHIVSNNEIRRKLTAELKEAFPDPELKLDYLTLQKLPYLTGCIKEGLRLSFSVPGRLPRVTPDPGAEFHGHFIPAGTVVGMSSWLMHRDSSIWPDPMTFSPDRWSDPITAQKLERYLVAFGRGLRACAGMPLAYCELYVTLAMIFCRFDRLQACEMGPEDCLWDDYFSGYPAEGSRIFQVKQDALT